MFLFFGNNETANIVLEVANRLAMGKTCFICETKQKNGITIGGQFMCEMCERSLVSTDMNDERYSYYLNRLAKLKTIFIEQV